MNFIDQTLLNLKAIVWTHVDTHSQSTLYLDHKVVDNNVCY